VEVLRELGRLRDGGLAVGLTVSGPRQADVIRRALAVELDGVNPFQVVQATWNVLEPSAGPALAEARGCGWGVIVKEALANGRLARRFAQGQVRVLTRIAEAAGTTTEALAIAAAASQPWVDVVLSGAVTLEQLRENLDALSLADRVTDWPVVAEAPEDYWSRRSAMPWQ
jgi:aryl-alcohol dehydrogenase-like predicted oxidoreductase